MSWNLASMELFTKTFFSVILWHIGKMSQCFYYPANWRWPHPISVYMQRSGVRPSVCLSVLSIKAASTCSWFAADRIGAGGIYRSMCRQHQNAAASGQRHAVIRGTRFDAELFCLIPRYSWALYATINLSISAEFNENFEKPGLENVEIPHTKFC